MPQNTKHPRAEIALVWLLRELTWLCERTTRSEEAQGTYASPAGIVAVTELTVLWGDLPFDWEKEEERQAALDYVAKLQIFLRQMLGTTDDVLIALLPVYHFR